MKKHLILTMTLLILASQAFGIEKTGRLGIGLSNQFKGDLDAISFKLQQSKSTAVGGLLALSNDPDSGGYAAGLKVYSTLFQEPYLNFYMGTMGGLLSRKIANKRYNGFQVDLSVGSEFFFQGIESLGFSFEVGVSISKLKNFVFETSGSQFIGGAVHFYL